MSVISYISRWQGASGQIQPYAAVSALTPAAPEGNDLHICYAALTGAMTINLTVTKLLQFQIIYFHFTADATNRAITFGTGFDIIGSTGVTGASITVPASSDSVVQCVFDGAALRILSSRVEGRGTTSETPVYAATIEVTDQYATLHNFIPGQLTGALTVNATAVTKWITGDQIIFYFATDGTQRIVTFGTNILSSGTITIPASKTAIARGWFNGTSIVIMSREISA